MSPHAPALALPADLLERLSRALETREPALALQAELSSCSFPDELTERVLSRALRVLERARERTPRASADELQLALGVLLVTCRAHGSGEGEAAS